MPYCTQTGTFTIPVSGVYTVESKLHLPNSIKTPDVLWRVRMLKRREYIFNLDEPQLKYLFAFCFNLQLNSEDSFIYRK